MRSMIRTFDPRHVSACNTNGAQGGLIITTPVGRTAPGPSYIHCYRVVLFPSCARQWEA
jgi:hypothetical protein